MRSPKALLPALLVALSLVAAFAAVAGADRKVAGTATLKEQGFFQNEQVNPSCPSTPCQAVLRTTGVQVKINNHKRPMTARRDGRLVAFTVKLGAPTEQQIAFFNQKAGGEAKAQVVVMRESKKGLWFRTTGASEEFELQPYFGRTAQFALKKSLTVKKGYVIGITVPTWAPILAVGLDNRNSWRAARQKPKCGEDAVNDPQTRPKDLTRMTCLYRTARLTYTATIISTP